MTEQQHPLSENSPSTEPKKNSGRRRPLVILLLLGCCMFAIFTQVGLYTIQPIGAIPDGVTAVVWRASDEPFFNSPDAQCLAIQGGVSVMCRAAALGAAPVERIIVRLPYMESAYLLSTGGQSFDR